MNNPNMYLYPRLHILILLIFLIFGLFNGRSELCVTVVDLLPLSLFLLFSSVWFFCSSPWAQVLCVVGAHWQTGVNDPPLLLRRFIWPHEACLIWFAGKGEVLFSTHLLLLLNRLDNLLEIICIFDPVRLITPFGKFHTWIQHFSLYSWS